MHAKPPDWMIVQMSMREWLCHSYMLESICRDINPEVKGVCKGIVRWLNMDYDHDLLCQEDRWKPRAEGDCCLHLSVRSQGTLFVLGFQPLGKRTATWVDSNRVRGR